MIGRHAASPKTRSTNDAPATLLHGHGLLRGQVALVTGSTRGIGRATAELFAREGAAVVVNGRYEHTVEEAARACEQEATRAGKEPRVLGVAADVRDPDAVAKLVKRTDEEFGRLDIGVSNAGITRDAPLLRMGEAEWDEVLDVNLRGAYQVARACARLFRKQRSGRLIFVTSIAGFNGNVYQANYAASKGGLIALTRSLAKELAHYNVLVNAIAPGVIDTELTQAYSQKIRDNALPKIPMSRFGTPDEVAGAILFLASPLATYITGEILCVGGGLGL